MFAGAGCVSSKYKLVPKSTGPTPPPALQLTTADPAVSATLHTVIVFHGPGSWKRDAYWDEYVVTLTVGGNEPLTIDDAALVDRDGHITTTGRDPWALDAASRRVLKVARRTGRNLVLGAGVGAAWYGSMALLASGFTIWGGVTNSAAVAAGATGFVAIPLVVAGSGVRTLVARHAVTKEFNLRRIALPATVPAGGSCTGSFFFPVTPAPAKLLVRYVDGAGLSHKLTVDLAPLARLHLDPSAQPPPAIPAPTGPATTPEKTEAAGPPELAPVPEHLW
jgi:hypothetical protein